MHRTPCAPGVGCELTVVGVPGPSRTAPDWRERLPILHGSRVTLRPLQLSDAPMLLAMMQSGEVSRFMSPPPATLEGFDRFITWTLQQQAAGQYFCLAAVPAGTTTAAGLFQVRSLDADFVTAEWGFAIGSSHWGTGLFMEAAHLVADFAFDAVGVHRLEARTVVRNGRANGALRKLGAIPEGVLRRGLFKDGHYHDQLIWSILEAEWRKPAVADVLH